MGKYTELCKTLAPTWGTEPAYQEKVNAVKDAILTPGEAWEHSDEQTEAVRKELTKLYDDVVCATGGVRTASVLAKAYAQAREAADTIEEALSRINLLCEAYSQLVTEQFNAEDCSTLRVASMGKAVITFPEPYAQVKDKALFRQWCIDNGFGDQLMLPWQTTNALTKQRLMEGEKEPDGVEAFTKNRVQLRKG